MVGTGLVLEPIVRLSGRVSAVAVAVILGFFASCASRQQVVRLPLSSPLNAVVARMGLPAPLMVDEAWFQNLAESDPQLGALLGSGLDATLLRRTTAPYSDSACRDSKQQPCAVLSVGIRSAVSDTSLRLRVDVYPRARVRCSGSYGALFTLLRSDAGWRVANVSEEDFGSCGVRRDSLG